MLSQLFQSGSHIGVRVAIVDSILARLALSNYELSIALAGRLLSALESGIPLLSSLNERRQTQEEDWIEAGKTGVLPEIYDDGGIDVYPPVLGLVVKAVSHRRIVWSDNRKSIIRRVLLPAIEQSNLNNGRWVKMFIAKHAPDIKALEVPNLLVKHSCPRLVNLIMLFGDPRLDIRSVSSVYHDKYIAVGFLGLAKQQSDQ